MLLHNGSREECVCYSCDKFATPLPKYDSEWANVADASSDFSGIKFGVLSPGRARPTEVIAVGESWNEWWKRERMSTNCSSKTKCSNKGYNSSH